MATGTRLHLVGPLGFTLEDRQLRRAGLDYWPRLNLVRHANATAFRQQTLGRRAWLMDSAGTQSLWDVAFKPGDLLVFGSETRGLDAAEFDAPQLINIPQAPGERCLNLATAAGIALYEALRQLR